MNTPNIEQTLQSSPGKLSIEYRHPLASLVWGVRFLPWLAGAALLLVVPGLDVKTQGAGTLIVLLALGFPLVLFLTFAAHLIHRAIHTPKKLTFTEDYIYYQTAFYQLQTDWLNVEAVSKPLSSDEPQALLLKDPAEVLDRFIFAPTAADLKSIPLGLFCVAEGASITLWLQKHKLTEQRL